MRKTKVMTKLKTNQKAISTRHNPSVRIKDSTAGITLIALVITIIVLLILAGVAISMLSGENGILTQAQQAKEKYESAAEEEQFRLDNMAIALNRNLKM